MENRNRIKKHKENMKNHIKDRLIELFSICLISGLLSGIARVLLLLNVMRPNYSKLLPNFLGFFCIGFLAIGFILAVALFVEYASRMYVINNKNE